jgi:molecular chaperone GrpE (heat shock protein)
MKKIKLTESDLTKIIEKVIKEQEEEGYEGEHDELHSSDVDVLHKRISELETELHELKDDYARKIGFGDHHVMSHGH